jgi:hypothetical protein
MQDLKIPAMFGVSRSGGTFIYNIVDEIYGGTVKPQSHHFFETNKKVIATYRDFRDSMISWWRMEVGKFDELSDSKSISKQQLVRYSVRMKGRIRELQKMKNHYDDKQILFLKYEDFFNNFEFIFSELEQFLEIKISDSMRKTIVSKYNLESQKKESKKFKDFTEYDNKRHIHGHHILNGQPSTWKNLVSQKHHFLLCYILKEELQKWGYND